MFFLSSVSLIEHQIHWLIDQDIQQIIVSAGSRSEVAAFARHVCPVKFLPNLHVITVDEECGTGGDLLRCINSLPELCVSNAKIVVCNVDTIVDCNVSNLTQLLDKHDVALAISLTENRDVQYQDSYFVGKNGVVLYSKECTEDIDRLKMAERSYEYRATSTGIIAISVKLLLDLGREIASPKFSLYNELIAHAIEKNLAFAFNNGTKLYAEIGSEPRWSYYTAQHPELIQPYLRYGASVNKREVKRS